MPRKIRVKEENKFKKVNEETKINKAKKVILMFFLYWSYNCLICRWLYFYKR